MTSPFIPVIVKAIYKNPFFIATFLCFLGLPAQSSDWNKIYAEITRQENRYADAFFKEKGLQTNHWTLDLSIQPPSQWSQRDCALPKVEARNDNWQPGTTYYSLICKAGEWQGKSRINRKAKVPMVTLLNKGSRHHVIQSSDITLQLKTLDRSTIRALFTPQDAIGYQLKHRLPKEHVLQTSDLSPVFWVTKHQAVTMLASGNGYKVKMSGEALESGHKGEWIRVKNNRSGKRLRGKIIAKGTVQVE